MGRATLGEGGAFIRFSISIHALRGEGDSRFHEFPKQVHYFYPRPPWGGRLLVLPGSLYRQGISIHALRGEGDAPVNVDAVKLAISIHALRGEGDWNVSWKGENAFTISIHALRGEGDGQVPGPTMVSGIFLSTPSVGRATSIFCKTTCCSFYFYPRPPWGGRRRTRSSRNDGGLFLSTPSVGRATSGLAATGIDQVAFLSTPSVGRATKQAPASAGPTIISIHALRGEGDGRGGVMRGLGSAFLSTPSVGRATCTG